MDYPSKQIGWFKHFKFAFESITLSNNAPCRFAPSRIAPERSAPERFALAKFAPARSALVRFDE